MNKLTLELRKILKTGAFCGLAACATIASGYQQSGIQNSNATQKATQLAETQQLHVEVFRSGALYIDRDHDDIYFWIIEGEDAEARVALHTVLRLPSEGQASQVNVKVEGISSIFYSDRLLPVNSVLGEPQVRYSIEGSFERGRTVLPIDQRKYDPLYEVRQQTLKPIADFPGVDGLFSEQMDVYAQVELVKEKQEMQTEKFVGKTSQLLDDYSNTVLELSESVKGFLSVNEVQALEVVDIGTSQVVEDLEAIRDAETELYAYLEKNKELNTYYFNCTEQGTVKLEQDMVDFEAIADRYTEESDREDPLEDPLDDLSEEQEVAYEEAQTEIHNCVGTEESIEQMASYELQVNIAEEGEYQDVANYEIKSLEIMDAAEQWGVKAYDKGMAFAEAAQAIVDVEGLADIERAFDPWISPAYLEASTRSADKKSWVERELTTNDAGNAPAQKMAETLCENYTDFDLEFNVFGVGVVIGTPLDDRIKTGNEPNLVVTLQGDDCIESHDGVDFVFSGPGEDKIFGGDHHDFLVGGKDDDEIHGSAGKTYSWGTGNVDVGNLILGAGGDDSLFGGEDDADKGEDGIVSTEGYTDIILGDLWYTGEPGKDKIKGERGIDFIFGEQEDDELSNAYTGAINLYGVNIKMGSFFFAGKGNDTINGSNSTGAGLTQLLGDFIFGSQGNDNANGKGGFDFIFGGEGNDTLSGGKYFDLVFGNQDDDTVNGNEGIDLVSGDKGDDKVYGQAGAFDLLLGGMGNDAMFGGDGVDLMFGSQGTDRMQGNDSVDLMFGGSEGDTLNGNDSVDILFGSKGADFLYGDAGVDIIFGGDDSDYVAGGASTDVIFGNENTDKKKRDNLNGQDGVDIIFGNRGNDYINGGNDTDVLFGNSDDDEIVGGSGVDIVFGNSGNDNISGESGTDILFGNSGDDEISGGGSTDIVFGNSGCDVMSGDDSTDILFGNSGADKIMGGAGTDVIFGNSGNDMIYGESGTDILFGNSDNDYINNGSGTNIVFGNDGNDHIIGGDNKDIIFGNRGNDYIAGNSDKDFIWGNRGHDTIDGGSSGDIIFGNRDNDLINAGSGTDWIWGNRGNDRIRGLEGKNRIWGNRGDDTLDGYLAGGDTKDKLRGNRHSDTLTGNSSNSRDKLRGGWGSDTKMRNVTLLPASLFVEPTYTEDSCLQ
ncbi:calcium-binding protein [Marinicella sp. W31]|uniref:calcium-binding protein n=1 Tax=Marinicella sp. W31 TaxID=3023713 RepID=UPI003756C0A9